MPEFSSDDPQAIVAGIAGATLSVSRTATGAVSTRGCD